MIDQTQMQLVDWLDDLTVRFLLNLPASELSSMPRLCFQVEEAQWFYEDFIRPAAAAAGNPLPNLPLRQFCLLLFKHCPLLHGFSDTQLVAAYEAFLAYKVRVPVRGAILMTWDMEKLLLVKGWKKGASWSFPRGKINQEEKDLDCAIREVYEETGYDVLQAGLVPENEKDVKYIDVAIREQHIRLFVFRGVPEDTFFEPKTRKEISKIQWYNIRDLPGFRKQKPGGDHVAHANKFYMVAPFLGPLKKWTNQQRRRDVAAAANERAAAITDDEAFVDEIIEQPMHSLPGHGAEDLKRLLSVGLPTAEKSHTVGHPLDAEPQSLLALLQGSAPPPTEHHPQAAFASAAGQRLDHQFPQQLSGAQSAFSLPTEVQQQPVAPWSEHTLTPHQIFASSADSPGPWSHMQKQPSENQSFYPQGSQMAQDPAIVTPELSQMRNLRLSPYQSHQNDSAGPNHPPAQRPGNTMNASLAGPRAENLPLPTLNAHSLNLLNAFKAPPKPPADARAQTTHQRGPSTSHQIALLDLLKKPGVPQLDASIPTGLPTQPTSNIGIGAGLSQELDSGTKTSTESLTTSSFTKQESKAARESKQERNANTSNTLVQQQNARDPNAGARRKQRPPPSTLQDADKPTAASPRARSQRSPSKTVRSLAPQSPKVNQNHNSPRQPRPPKRSDTQTPTPQFTILARPGSSRGTSAAGNDAAKLPFQPQVLKRNEVDGAAPIASGENTPSVTRTPEDRKDKLLALFGKSSLGPSTSTQDDVRSTSPSIAAASAPAQARKTNLLNLLGAPNTNAPGLSPLRGHSDTPEGKISVESAEQPRHQKPQQQNALLGLLSKPGASVLESPSTPISPFSLGTPVRRDAPQLQVQGHVAQPSIWQQHVSAHGGAHQHSDSKSRISSISSVRDQVRSPSVSGHATPTEAKGFLLDYLNGVVQKEAYRGASK